jgi:hypothetical protein
MRRQRAFDQAERGVRAVLFLKDGRTFLRHGQEAMLLEVAEDRQRLGDISDRLHFTVAHIAVGGRDDNHSVDERGVMADGFHGALIWRVWRDLNNLDPTPQARNKKP